MRPEDIIKLQKGDIVEIHYGNSHYDYGRISHINYDDLTAEIAVVASSTTVSVELSTTLIEKSKWTLLTFAPISEKTLRLIGFKPTTDEIAFGKTAAEWVKVADNGNRLWDLRHRKDASWSMAFDEVIGIETQPIREVNNIGWIHQIQHYVNSPELMPVVKL